MPNWCANRLSITGPAEAIVKVKALDLDFNKVIPYPQLYALLDKSAEMEREANPTAPWPKDGYNSGGYEWCIEHWGTKWPATRVELQKESKTNLRYTFDTAWAPPLPIIDALSAMFPAVTFRLRYYECGCAYQGRLTVNAGTTTDEWQGAYHGGLGG